MHQIQFKINNELTYPRHTPKTRVNKGEYYFTMTFPQPKVPLTTPWAMRNLVHVYIVRREIGEIKQRGLSSTDIVVNGGCLRG